MSAIDDLKNAVEVYETEKVNTQIVDYALIPPAGMVLNTGDKFKFKIKVTNQGHLDMRDVQVRVNGTDHAKVSLTEVPDSSYGPNAVSAPFNADANTSPYKTGYFYGKADTATTGSEVIVTAQIYSWNASLDHILKDHSGAGASEGTLNRTITIT